MPESFEPSGSYFDEQYDDAVIVEGEFSTGSYSEGVPAPEFRDDLMPSPDLIPDQAGDTPLHIAARTGTSDVFDWLVK